VIPAALTPSSRRVLCVGDMTVDIFAAPMPALPEPGEVRLTERMAVFPGGNALNTAVALCRLGEAATFFGCVGDDAFGDLLLGELSKLGLDLRGVTRESGCDTPTTLIYRAQNEDRRYISSLGAGERFTGKNVPAELIPDRGVVLAAGFLKLRAWDDAALAGLFREARRRGCTTVLNVCIPSQAGIDPCRCLRLLPLVDVFVPNEDEARVLTGAGQPAGQARVLRDAGAGAVIITRGARGLFAEDSQQTVEMGAFAVPLVDPTGCGDCFTAGVIASLLQQWKFAPMLEFASALGALAATALGSTSAVPPLADVARFVRENQAEPPVKTVSAYANLSIGARRSDAPDRGNHL
jgi:sugar/nucleoside kinase (ribokinase family)